MGISTLRCCPEGQTKTGFWEGRGLLSVANMIAQSSPNILGVTAKNVSSSIGQNGTITGDVGSGVFAPQHTWSWSASDSRPKLSSALAFDGLGAADLQITWTYV